MRRNGDSTKYVHMLLVKHYGLIHYSLLKELKIEVKKSIKLQIDNKFEIN